MEWYKLASKPSEANSGIYTNIGQGFILNLVLNHIQYAVITNNQSKDTWFVPLLRNMNCAITYTDVHKKLSCFWQVHPWFKDKYTGANHSYMSASPRLAQQTKGLAGLHGESFLTCCWMSLKTVNMPDFCQNYGKIYILYFILFICKIYKFLRFL